MHQNQAMSSKFLVWLNGKTQTQSMPVYRTSWQEVVYMEFKTYIQSSGPTKSYIYYIRCLHVLGNSFRSSLTGHYPPFSTPEHGISTPELFWPTRTENIFALRAAHSVLWLMKFYSTPLLNHCIQVVVAFYLGLATLIACLYFSQKIQCLLVEVSFFGSLALRVITRRGLKSSRFRSTN